MSKLLSRPSCRSSTSGCASFAESIGAAPAAQVTQVDWAPPAPGDRAVGAGAGALVNHPRGRGRQPQGLRRAIWRRSRCSSASASRARRLPGMGRAHDPARRPADRLGAHVRPDAGRDHRRDPLRGLGDRSPTRAQRSRRAATIAFEPCHHHARRRPDGRRHQPVDAGLDRREAAARQSRLSATSTRASARCCASAPTAPEVIERLRWMAARARARRWRAALKAIGRARAEAADGAGAAHGRRGAQPQRRRLRAAAQAARARAAASRRRPRPTSPTALDFIAGNDHFFLNLSMAACKAMLDAAHGVPGSSLVTAMARNGVDFGIRVSGTGDAWFTAPAPLVDGLYFPAYRSPTPRPTSATAPSPRRRASAASPWRRRPRS